MSPTEVKQWKANAVVEGRNMRDVVRAHAVRYAAKEECQEVNICDLDGDIMEVIGRGTINKKPDDGTGT